MRRFGYLAFDISCVSLMLLVSLYLRNGAVLIEEGRPGDVTTLLFLTIATSLLVLPLMNTHKRLWRYTSSVDLTAIIISATLIVLLTNGGMFLFNRLDIVPRSVPPMHWALSVVMLCGARLMARRMFGPSRKQTEQERASRQHILILGTGHVAELYLEFIKRIAPGHIVVEGVIDEDPSLTHRSFHQHTIIGMPENLEQALEQFHVHGIRISQIVLAQPFESLSMRSKQTLLELERNHNMKLVHFEKQFGIMPASTESAEVTFIHSPSEPDYYVTPHGSYPVIKRAIDIAGALALGILFAPIMLITAFLVYVDVGQPLLFWQQRPGYHGKPFRLYKFRTMRPARRRLDEERLAHKTGDSKRTSIVGHWIRRLRFDELPQLFHILTGTMSFIGPRPLLPDDQPQGGEARLSIRPGITGWAQVHGGDALTAEQKLVLDLWYIENMSFWLDIKIALMTILVACRGDKPATDMIDTFRAQLRGNYPKAQPTAKVVNH